MDTNEQKVLLYLEQGLHRKIIEYFDPLLFLKDSPVFLSETFVEEILLWYVEKTKFLNLIDIYYLSLLTEEAALENIILKKLFNEEEVYKKIEKFNTLYNTEDFNLSGLEYFSKFPYGRVLTTVNS